MMRPHFCHGDHAFFAGPAGNGCASGRTIVDIGGNPVELATPLTSTLSSAGRGEGSLYCLARDLLDAGDHLVGGLLRRPAVVDHAAHRLGPYVFVVENRELVVLGELERR